jgi:hypothetical protein
MTQKNDCVMVPLSDGSVGPQHCDSLVTKHQVLVVNIEILHILCRVGSLDNDYFDNFEHTDSKG